MKIDYISDLHEDFYIDRIFKNNEEFINYIWKNHEIGDILFILGDLSENSNRIIQFLQDVKNIKKYKKILFVAGNHDLYSEDGINELRNKLELIKEKIHNINNDDIILLDGQIIEFQGYKISGSTMWYDTSYFKMKFPYLKNDILERSYLDLWEQTLYDSKRTSTNPISFFKEEIEKFKNIYNKVDIFLTHFNPVPYDSNMDKKYKGSITNTFFCFDGIKYLSESSIKHFFYGHTHSAFEDKIFNTYLHCNPLGYPNENKYSSNIIKSIIL